MLSGGLGFPSFDRHAAQTMAAKAAAEDELAPGRGHQPHAPNAIRHFETAFAAADPPVGGTPLGRLKFLVGEHARSFVQNDRPG